MDKAILPDLQDIRMIRFLVRMDEYSLDWKEVNSFDVIELYIHSSDVNNVHKRSLTDWVRTAKHGSTLKVGKVEVLAFATDSFKTLREQNG